MANGKKLSKDEMKCNKPVKSWRAGKKYAVKACSGGEEKLLHFGAIGYEDYLQHKDKERRASFKARHKCSEQKDKLTAAYWACNYNW